MRQLNKITFINSADYDYFELKVDGDIAVYGINDGGKTTCARAVMFGEHGAEKALNFGQGESMDYYFHKGQREGLLIYDYSETRSDGLVLPYCLIVSSQHIHFVTAAFDKSWVIVDGNKYTTDWSKIRASIDTQVGDVQVFSVSSMRNLEIILQGTYTGRDDDMRRMTKLFSMFSGRDGKPGAVAKVIESLWKNGEMKQEDMKRIIIERAEADKKERLEREPSFEVTSARSLSDGFDDGWKDFSQYVSGALPERMTLISDTYREYEAVRGQLRGFPSVINSVRKKKMDILESERQKAREKNELLSATSLEKTKLYDLLQDAFQQRAEAIGKLKGEIKTIKSDYNKYSQKEWEKNEKDILDLANSGKLNREVELLRKAIEAIEKSDEEYTRTLLDEIANQKSAHETLLSETHIDIAKLRKECLEDKKIADLNEKKAGVRAEAENAEPIKAERTELSRQKEMLNQEQKDIDRARDSLTKINGNTSLMDKFESGNDLSFLGKIGHEIISRFFKLVYVFICKELFDLDDLSEGAIEKKQQALAKAKKAYNARVEAYQDALKKETTRLSALYEGQISEVVRGYNDRENELTSNLNKSKTALDEFIKQKEEEIDKVRASNGIDVEDLKRKKTTCEEKEQRYDYLINNSGAIGQLENIRKKYATVSESQNRLDALNAEHKQKSQEEAGERKQIEEKIQGIEKELNSINTTVRQIEKDLSGFETRIPQLSALFSLEESALLDIIDKAPVVELDPGDEKRLCDYLDEWKEVSEKRKETIISLRAQCQALQGTLSPKDFFDFSIKPEDSLVSDADILRVADIVTRRNDASSEESIIPFLNNWRRTWNEYLRWIYKVGERATNLSNVTETARRLQSFINRNNEAHSILDIGFEIESGSDNPIVKKALELKECLDRNGVDIYSVDVTDGVDSNLFKLETLSENLRRRLVNIMSDFTKALSEYKYDAIPPEDFFTLYTCIKEENKARLRLLSVKEIGSTGTGLTTKSILTICFVGEALRQDKSSRTERNTIHIFVDEFGRIDHWNKDAIKKMCSTFGVLLFSAEPYASNETGGVKYGYALHYDKKTHHRGCKPIKEKRLRPVGAEPVVSDEPGGSEKEVTQDDDTLRRNEGVLDDVNNANNGIPTR